MFLKTSSAIDARGADGAWPRTVATESRLRTIAAVAAATTPLCGFMSPPLSQPGQSGNLHADEDGAQPEHDGDQSEKSCRYWYDRRPIPPRHAPFNCQSRHDGQHDDEHLEAKRRHR